MISGHASLRAVRHIRHTRTGGLSTPSRASALRGQVTDHETAGHESGSSWTYNAGTGATYGRQDRDHKTFDRIHHDEFTIRLNTLRELDTTWSKGPGGCIRYWRSSKCPTRSSSASPSSLLPSWGSVVGV